MRLQVQTTAAGSTPKYSGLFGTMGTVAKEEGVGALWKGLEPGLHRQCLYGGLRIGLYDPLKQLIVGKDHVGDVPLPQKILAGLLTGGIAIAIACPTDLVKVRMQAEGKLAPGMPKKYPSAFAAYGIIAKEEGIAGLWTGLGPNVMRNSVINATELASYDQIKQVMLASGIEDGVGVHLSAGLGAGFAAVCVGSPVDVVKSRVMGDKEGLYKGTLDCFAKTLANDGPLAFYKGSFTMFRAFCFSPHSQNQTDGHITQLRLQASG